ncbi:polyamine-transporting ATPase 13A2 isoform X3 [Varanus komodoensis]|uniref:polyamine-transporting ATPase 13A2 isoform X3 n=1 Tax=Varanus komodoensis TaxID=61221 RepID=UPI001CF77ED4|nr:polyamine-transporting ATPase 13A2 isoform X3 [Varanus komodoensis]
MSSGGVSLLGRACLGYRTLQESAPQEPRMEVIGYQRKRWKTILCHIFTVLFVGLPLAIFYWKPHVRVQARCSRCPLRQADWVVIHDQLGQNFTAKVERELVGEGSPEQGEDDGRASIAVGAVEDEDGSCDTIRLHQKEQANIVQYFVFEGLRYIWMEKLQAYCRASKLDESWTCLDIHLCHHGLSTEEQAARRKIYGPNLIDVPVHSPLQLLRDEVLNPFYIFQIFSIILWFCEDYYWYAICILLISAISIGISLYETKKQRVTLQKMVKVSISVKLRRALGGGIADEVLVSSVDLVPGDCILVPAEGMLVPCDAALLTGECMVNESMLTGESTPVMKTPLPQDPQAAGTAYSPEQHKRHTLFCGTRVLQARCYTGTEVLAVVTRTGFCTAKGDLVSSILYPKPVNFRFYKDAAKFVIVLAGLAALGTAYSIYILHRKQVAASQIVIRALDVVTVVVPPALPAAMTAGTIYAQSRLKQQGIFCISPPRINLCGKVRLACFDKTGTLTEDGFDVWGVVPRENCGFLPLIHELHRLPGGPLLSCLATCHTVSVLKGQLVGDPADLKMLESTGWTQEEVEGAEAEAQVAHTFGTRALVVMSPPEQPPGTRQVLPLAILRRFPFASSLQRMSVLVKPPGDALPEVYMKGAPEIVAGLCTSESVPTDLSQALCRFTRDGFRVLGLAYKPVVAIGTFEEVQDVSRDSVESQMCFLGLLVLKNVLKAETTPVIHSLRSAEIRTVMATGDNMLTAISVARNCHMVEAKEPVVFVNAAPPDHGSPATLRFTPAEQATEPAEGSYQLESYFPEQHACHLAMDGKSFAVVCEHFPDVLPKILVRTTILARMLPEQKALLVQKLQELNYCVLMCGDGANDCGALKAADVGISLSEAEASVASPFTSRTANVECVPAVIREGRCSLVTSFGIFKYMALYSLVQFVSVLLLYTINTNLSDSQFLFFDLAITSTVAALMGRTAPATGLGPARPRGTLISVPVLGSLLLQTGLLIAVQVGSYLIATSQQWFVPLNSTVTAPRNIPNYENTVVFCITGFQYLTLAVAMSKGDPFRKPLYTNVVFLIALIVLFGLMIWLTLHPLNFMKKLLKLKGIDDLEFKAGLLGMATIHFFMAFVLEILLEHGLLGCLRKWRRRTSSKKRYKMLERELREQQPTWPLMHEPLFAPSKASVATR